MAAMGVADDPQVWAFRLRVDRARQLYAEFGRIWAQYLHDRPACLDLQINSDGRGRIVFERSEPLPAMLSVVLGDFLQQLRAALDNCLYALAIIDSAVDPPPNAGRLQWPIAITPAQWPGQIKPLAGLSPRLLTALEAIQPYQAELPEWNCLRILHEMARVDRHRMPHLVTTFHAAGRVRVDTTRIADFSANLGPIAPGGVVATFRRLGDGPITEDHLHVDLEFDVDVSGVEMSPSRPGGAPTRPWGSLDHRMQALLRAVVEYTEGLVEIAQLP